MIKIISPTAVINAAIKKTTASIPGARPLLATRKRILKAASIFDIFVTMESGIGFFILVIPP
jgi:hypothetical protein